jgi:hypothetical protein
LNFRFFFRTCAYEYAQWSSFASFFLSRSQLFSGSVWVDFPTYASGLFTTRFTARTGLVDSAPSDAPVTYPFAHAATLKPRAVVIVGLSLRYTHPALIPQLRRFRASGAPLIELGGSAAQFVDYSLGAGPRALFSFFRFKMRAAVLFSQAVFLTSGRFYKLFGALLPSFYTCILPEAPYPHGQLARVSSCVRLVFASYICAEADFQIPLAHPLEVPAVYFPTFATGPIFSPQILMPRAAEPATFSLLLAEPVFSSLPSLEWPFPDLSIVRRAGCFYSSYNYYDHFAGVASLRHSNINLLNLQRNADYRHSHFCTV